MLPVQPYTITAEVAAAYGMPDCLIGAVYRFEPVPTAVTQGPDGMLYVTTLPGGPEDPSLGGRGSVYRVDPSTGAYQRLYGRLLGPTDIAVTPNGDIYVAELFAGRLTCIVPSLHSRYTVATLPNIVSVAYGYGHLYAGTSVPLGASTTTPSGARTWRPHHTAPSCASGNDHAIGESKQALCVV